MPRSDVRQVLLVAHELVAAEVTGLHLGAVAGVHVDVVEAEGVAELVRGDLHVGETEAGGGELVMRHPELGEDHVDVVAGRVLHLDLEALVVGPGPDEVPARRSEHEEDRVHRGPVDSGRALE